MYCDWSDVRTGFCVLFTGHLFTSSFVFLQEGVETGVHLDPALKEVDYNPSYETMFAPEVRRATGKQTSRCEERHIDVFYSRFQSCLCVMLCN